MKQPLLQTAMTILFLSAGIFYSSAQYRNVKVQRLAEQTISRGYTWNFNGHLFTHTFTFKNGDYLYYRGLSKDQPYDAYCCDREGHRYLSRTAKELRDMAAGYGYGGRELAEFILCFVHSVPYRSDPVRSNGGDYPRYPIESLVESSGSDCEDHSALLAGLLSALGFDVVLISLPSHMAAGIACDGSVPFYLHRGKRYAFMEAVPCKLHIGDVPAEYLERKAGILDIAHASLHARSGSDPLNPATESDTHISILDRAVRYLFEDRPRRHLRDTRSVP